jgi:hypothetical protein
LDNYELCSVLVVAGMVIIVRIEKEQKRRYAREQEREQEFPIRDST